jgi:hypothetical protein
MSSTQAPRIPIHDRQRLAGVTGLLRQRSVQLTAAGWVVANVWVVVAAQPRVPFDWPALGERQALGHLVDVNVAMVQVLMLIAVVVALTSRRDRPDLAARAPDRSVARKEALLLLLYGAAGLSLGFLLARAFGWHPFGLHLAGTLFGTHDHVRPAEAVAWAAYNLVVYAVIPLAYFRRRYSAESLNLRSSDRRKDANLILVILAIETAFQVLVLQPELLELPAPQLLWGATLTFVLFMAGAVLPAMVFIYAILVPRFLRITGSTASTVILGGLVYAALHVWDSWTAFTSPGTGALSAIFLLFTYLGPGMVKTVLTVRTGNAWVHVWAYHAFAPHVLHETPQMVRVFHVP